MTRIANLKRNGLLALSLLLSAPAVMAQVSFTSSPNTLPSLGGWNSAPACVVDMNDDNRDDVVRLDGNTLKISFQDENGDFTETSFGQVVHASLWSIAAADIDNNGYTDLLLGDGSWVEFVYATNDGTGYNSDVQPEDIFCQRSTFADINNDGMLDAFVCHDVDTCHPYLNINGILTRKMDLIETAPFRGNYSAIWCDYDNDRDQDLYITKCVQGGQLGDTARVNGLYQNDGQNNFTEVGHFANMNDGDQSWTTCMEDWDNDGDLDAFTVNHEVSNRLMDNNGDGTFSHIIGASGIDPYDLGAWEATCGDFDNDGFIDILTEVGAPGASGRIYWNQGDGTFVDDTTVFNRGGVGDLNGDGFLDVFNGQQVFINEANSNNYLMVSLEGVLSNRDAIGARVEIFGGWGKQIREVRSGTSFSTHNSHNVHFGLGFHAVVDSMVIYWPSGIKTVDTQLLANTHLEVLEVTEPSAVSEYLQNDYEISAFPNPVTDNLTVKLDPTLALSGHDVQLKLVDLSGRVMVQQRVNGQTQTIIDCSNFAKGAYFMQIMEGVKPVFVRKVVVD